MSELRISSDGENYYVNGKKVIDPLQLPIKERIALDAYKKNIEDGMKIQSTYESIKKGEKENEEGKNDL